MTEDPADDAANSAVPEEAGVDLPAIPDGGWMNIPGAFKAIARVVMSVGESAASWVEVAGVKAEQKKEMIRSDTEARKALNAALVVVAKEMATGDPAIVERSMRRWIGEETKKQVNREETAKKAAEELNREPPPADTEGPSEDWLNQFGSHAEKASSEEMRTLFGKVLAGEIRKPGSVSLMTLQFMSVLDGEAASIVMAILPYVVNNAFVPNDASAAAGLGQGYLIISEAFNFGNHGSGLISRVVETDANNRVFFRSGLLGLVLEFQEYRKLQIASLLLSPIGQQLSRIIPSASKLFEMAPHFWTLEPITLKKGVAIDNPDGTFSVHILMDVPKPEAQMVEPAPST